MLTTTLSLNRTTRIAFDSQAVHRTLLHATDGKPVLWASPDTKHLVVRHETPVDWIKAIRGVTQAVTLPTQIPAASARINYALIGNPILSQYQGPNKRGKKTPAPPEKWNEWLQRRVGNALNLHSIDGTRLPPAKGKKPDMQTIHHRILFTGRATVKDQDALQTLMESGIGSGKAYGCGLLIVEEL
ncbi:type I-E CRISPR-associated protein Cas6/Cse3/CasE [Corynebacterium striatum]|uniref:Type I-E CRISPR-associated protein Cas6/Cse3/CasE n=1 Tax=Corynebacterium striatum TaxID=43770 RepID=A0AAQ1TXK3_CORST|nr:CRISPR system CASCADE complex protein CasE [Corynebacterium striatum ATCC 6940]QQE52048.1 type I-E CRISPR-associated protein Cas6/Cse3/CasE [Corynebacterium striatum]STD63100.1 CRISPR-associated protein Cas6/Cse3/CasE, subtype I-E/ECOLI [Corynebacterium striatum]GEA42078.1 hypothetical protein Cst04h_02480 [Corynebacterium striatum]GEA44767.1 hypothetical protein Cst04h_29370 [Corynebacterium striatum]